MPEIEDFAYCFDQEQGNLWMFGGYFRGSKSNVFIKIHVNSKKVTVINPDTKPSHPNSENVPE